MKFKLRILLQVVAALFVLFPANAQKTNLRVRVSDASGPLAGAVVIVKGSSLVATTDSEGTAVLSGIPEDATIEVSMMGYEVTQIQPQGRSLVEVVLQEEAQILDELVFIGYGAQKKKDLTGSVVRADIETFRQTTNATIMESLHGTVAGLNVGQVNSAGANPDISVRGQITLGGNTSPLIILDGIIYSGRISDINPSDIESVDVLKDASSKAVYGAQAANGVLILTTRSGSRESAPKVSYSGTFGFSEPTVKTRLLNRDEWLQRLRDVEYEKAYTAESGYLEENPAWDYTMAQLFSPTLEGIAGGTDFDWWEACTQTGHVFKHNVSVSGGSRTASYFLSGSHSDITGITMNDSYKRNTLRANLDVNVTDWLKAGSNISLAFLDYSGESPAISSIKEMNPVVSPRDADGNLVHNPTGQATLNPFIYSQSADMEKKHQINAVLYAVLDCPWVQGLSYRLNYNYRLNAAYDANFNPDKSNFLGRGEKSYKNNYYWLLDNIVSYNRTFNRHHVSATLVYGASSNIHDETGAVGTGYANGILGYNKLQLAENTQEITSSAYSESSLYQVGRLSYNYAGRYFLTATLRRDGFSGFAQNHKFGIFPSVGLGWTVSEENFMKGLHFLDELKIRVSYGKTGNLTGRYSSLAQVSVSNPYVFGDGASTSVGYNVTSLASTDLSWETTGEINAGLDFSLWKGRLEGNIDGYISDTRDLLWDMAVPSVTGFKEMKTNLGRIRNSGIEIMLKAKPIVTADFEWNIQAAFSANRNRIETLLGEDLDGDGREDDLIASNLFIGQPIGAIYNYQIDGMWQLGDDIPAGWYPGTYIIHDFGDSGKYEISKDDDRIILGHKEPAYRLGITNTFRYRNVSFSFMINTIQGGRDGYMASNSAPYYTTAGNAQNANVFTFVDVWSPRNPDAVFPQSWLSPQVAGTFYQQRNFVRLQDVSLSYRLGRRAAKAIGAESLSASISGKNLLTFTKWVGWDPEMNLGADSVSKPVMRSLSVGIDVTF